MNQIPDPIRERIAALDSIPSIPTVIQPLLSLLQQPPEKVDVTKLEELVARDKSIALQCLRMANSPLFARRPVENIGSAIMVLGWKRMESILVSCSLNQFVPADTWVLEPVVFWRHCLGCALVTRKLAQLIGYEDPEKAYLAGLLHDLGILVNSLVCPDELRRSLETAARTQMALHSAEQSEVGFTHCDTGAVLAQRWCLPPDLCDPIATHHSEDASTQMTPLACLVHLADLLCRVRDLGYGYYEALRVDICADPAWAVLVERYPFLTDIDIARFTLDIEGAMDEISTVVNAVFAGQN